MISGPLWRLDLELGRNIPFRCRTATPWPRQHLTCNADARQSRSEPLPFEQAAETAPLTPPPHSTRNSAPQHALYLRLTWNNCSGADVSTHWVGTVTVPPEELQQQHLLPRTPPLSVVLPSCCSQEPEQPAENAKMLKLESFIPKSIFKKLISGHSHWIMRLFWIIYFFNFKLLPVGHVLLAYCVFLPPAAVAFALHYFFKSYFCSCCILCPAACMRYFVFFCTSVLSCLGLGFMLLVFL